MSNPFFDLSGRTAFITGAASGLGFAMTEAMVENGAAVCLADIDPEGLEKAGEYFRRISNRVETLQLDVRDADSIKAGVKAFADRHGRLYIVFANAGITG